MANGQDSKGVDSATDATDDSLRVTPRHVEPDSTKDGEKAQSSGRTLRDDPSIEEAPGGDRAGVAGGGVDSNVSGLGGGNRR